MDFVGQTTRVVTDRQIDLADSIMAIGAFDGVHRGHQHLITGAIKEARAVGTTSLVWTFDPPPKVVFGRAEQLCTLEEKLARIAHLGPDMIVVARFDRLYAARSAGAFLDDISRANPRRIHVGEDFRFGHKQSGDVARLGDRFDVLVPTPVACADGKVVSSTRIRALRAAGQRAEADTLQGPFDMACQLAGRLLTTDLRHHWTM